MKRYNIPYILFRKIDRLINQLHRYDYPDKNDSWEKKGRVYGDLNSGTMFDPYVLYDGSFFKMLVSERKTGNLILVDSKNGFDWSNKINVLSGIDGAWDSVVNRGCLLHNDGIWHLWYTGQNNHISSIGYAISHDGKLYKRKEIPVVSATLSFEGVSVMNPCVLWDCKNNKYRMWYSAGENYEPDVICYAESVDGINWTKYTAPVLELDKSRKWEQYKVGGCFVTVDDDGVYTLYYIGYQNVDVARICYATSKDGINWVRDDNNLILSPTKGAWDSDAVYKPSILQCEGKLYLWYNGRKGKEEYIGLATKRL